MALLDNAQQYLGQNEVGQISQQLGINPNVARTAIAAALPMIVGGLARHASNSTGADAIKQAASAHASITDNVSTVIQAGPPADASGTGGLLGRVFGQHRDAVEQSVQQASGLESEKARKLLMILSPIVLGVLARRQFGNQNVSQIDSGQLAGALQQEAQNAQRQSPNVGGLLGKLLSGAESPRA
jgi:hypothetical protein